MRRWLRPLVVRLLRRDPDEVGRRARSFRIEDERGHALVAELGRAFIDGYNAMLGGSDLGRIAADASRIGPHFRPFYFEGAAMGYLPRALHDPRCRPELAARHLLDWRPEFRYLYHVGLGFWYGFRHRRQPSRVMDLARAVDALHLPLCFDGFGFKLGFFDFPGRPEAVQVLERCPTAHAAALYQGFGRAHFFVYMHDEASWQGLRRALPARHAADLELGRSLACGFTGVDRPEDIARYLDGAPDATDRGARLTGVTWALTARRMNDADYFAHCMERATPATRALLERLPELCDRALEQAASYADWQARTCEAVRQFADGRPA